MGLRVVLVVDDVVVVGAVVVVVGGSVVLVEASPDAARSQAVRVTAKRIAAMVTRFARA
jgi:hypothetical protein